MILDSTKSSQSLECIHASEGAIRGLHVVEKITCLLQIHDDFYEFSSILLIFALFRSMIDLNTKYNIQSMIAFIYIIKLLKTKQNKMIK